MSSHGSKSPEDTFGADYDDKSERGRTPPADKIADDTSVDAPAEKTQDLFGDDSDLEAADEAAAETKSPKEAGDSAATKEYSEEKDDGSSDNDNAEKSDARVHPDSRSDGEENDAATDGTDYSERRAGNGAASDGEDAEEAEEAPQPVDPKQAEIDEMNQKIDSVLKSGRSRRRKRTDEDDASVDEIIVELRKRMRDAAYRDIDDNKDRLPAIHKLSMLPDVVDELGKTQLYEAFLDNNIVDSIRLWLEPLDDGSLPSLDIQNAMLDILKKLPVRRDHLRESGIGKIILFMSKCPRIPEINRRICEQFVQQWSRMVLRLSSDFRDRKIREASVDMGRRQFTAARPNAATANRRTPGGIQIESGSGRDGDRATARIPQRVAADYTVMPVSSHVAVQPASSRNISEKFKRLKQAISKSGR
ncbi:hypothetical protein BX661DRAFT_177660 [Kickxella alabastrina]|uniref:uncharacterized protein n=1 Tax=Kickxella alabastrina TaxID=61397 RepID=UPI00221FBFDC|nr:uncharacterized protein BX661DRAFT_177660 [Kickxella alabastrina]KAI7833843.1 hypothetical protein BX661DRAFT_177660 [Kickxella alabastrina]